MQGALLCCVCGLRTIESGETACSACRQRRSQPEAVLTPLSLRICAVCGRNEARYVCICAFPLVDLCSACRQKHVSAPAAAPHCVQPKSAGEFIQSAKDYQHHIARIERIQGAIDRLKAWTLATVEQAKVSLGDTVKRLHWTLDEQHKGWLEMLQKTEEKVSALEAVLEEMKADCCLRTGTFVDLWVEEQREDLLQSLGGLVAYQIRQEEVCDFANLLLYQDNVPVAAPDRSNAPILDHSQVFSSSISLFSPRISTFPNPSSSPAVHWEAPIPQFQSFQRTPQPSNVCPDPKPCPSLCSHCHKYLLPNRSQYSSTDQVSICSCSAPSAPCAICQRPISDFSWTLQVRAELWRFRDSCQMVCSMDCFEQICRLIMPSERPKRDTNSPQMCIFCKEAIGAVYITLQCGHQFHDIKCFYAFLKLKSANFQKSVDYFCGICRKKIEFEVLDTFFGYASHMKTISIYKSIICAVCRNFIAVLSTPCNHPICTNCAKKGNASCQICGTKCLLS